MPLWPPHAAATELSFLVITQSAKRRQLCWVLADCTEVVRIAHFFRVAWLIPSCVELYPTSHRPALSLDAKKSNGRSFSRISALFKTSTKRRGGRQPEKETMWRRYPCSPATMQQAR